MSALDYPLDCPLEDGLRLCNGVPWLPLIAVEVVSTYGFLSLDELLLALRLCWLGQWPRWLNVFSVLAYIWAYDPEG